MVFNAPNSKTSILSPSPRPIFLCIFGRQKLIFALLNSNSQKISSVGTFVLGSYNENEFT